MTAYNIYGYKDQSGRGYLPDQWRLANVAYPLFLRQRRVNDGGVGWGLGKAA